MAYRSGSSAPARIIAIDDSQQSLWILEAVLVRAGFQVSTLSDTATVFSRVFAERPDAILCDVLMPGLTGPALMQMLRKVELGRRTPILLWSALPEPELADLAERCGADGYILKSAPEGVIVERIRSALSRAVAAHQPERP